MSKKTSSSRKKHSPKPSSKSKSPTSTRGQMMRRIAALHAKMAISSRTARNVEKGIAERIEIKRQLAELEKQMMAM